MFKSEKIIYAAVLGVFLFISPSISAQEVFSEIQDTVSGRVVEIIKEEEKSVEGTAIRTFEQVLKVELSSGEEIQVENDFVRLKKGDRVFLDYRKTIEGKEYYTFAEPDRRVPLAALVIIFAAVVVILGGKQGVRALLSLAGSLFFIFYLLLPLLLKGYSPIVTSVGVAVAILAVAIYVTHGFNRVTTAAFLGTAAAAFLTGLFALAATAAMKFSGFSSDETVYLNLFTEGRLSLNGLFLGAVLIGVLGVLDDIAVTQAAAVRELKHAAPDLSRKELSLRAMRIGREHVGALINTLVLAYVGAALPLLLLFYGAETSVWLLLNREIFAVEIVRTIVGSFGIILAVPITTWIAALLLKGDEGSNLHYH